MCGLVFLYQPGCSEEELREKAMLGLEKIRHRGPDDEGMMCAPPVVVGHRRLSIIDLSGSHQPISDESGRYVLAYNGEIYNYRKLRARLEPHWNFRTCGDTEVVLAGLAIYGSDFLCEMEGMWALSLWDRQKNQLLLARDRMGKKPLYYKSRASGFACASELSALHIVSSSNWDEDLDSTADYLRYGFYLPGTTAYNEVFEVLPGHTLTWSPGERPELHPYWSLSVVGYSGTRQRAQEELRDSLIAAVERRMVADVEVGAFLSGGVDSSLVVSILARYVGVSPKTFTIGFSDPSFDEREFARKMANLCGTDHYEECLTSWDADKLRSLIFCHVGQPFADASMLPTAMVSQLAAKYVKVSLSGDGGDELFSGYQRYQARAIMRWYMRLPALIRRNIKSVIRAMPEPMAHHSRSLLKKAHLFQSAVDRQESESPYVAPVLSSRAEFDVLVPELRGKGHQPPGLPAETTLDDVQAMMAADAVIYLPQDILAKVDRSSMAYSLETRAPFLDSKVVELAFSLPRKWHRRGLSGKRILQESFRDLLPPGIWKRRKQGFGVPVHQWFREGLGSELKGLLEEVESPLEGDKVIDLINAHRERVRDNGSRLWNIYIYLLWRQRSSH
jgi:asparagine synthase (glutamine-hydrolysing)